MENTWSVSLFNQQHTHTRTHAHRHTDTQTQTPTQRPGKVSKASTHVCRSSMLIVEFSHPAPWADPSSQPLGPHHTPRTRASTAAAISATTRFLRNNKSTCTDKQTSKKTVLCAGPCFLRFPRATLGLSWGFGSQGGVDFTPALGTSSFVPERFPHVQIKFNHLICTWEPLPGTHAFVARGWVESSHP